MKKFTGQINSNINQYTDAHLLSIASEIMKVMHVYQSMNCLVIYMINIRYLFISTSKCNILNKMAKVVQTVEAWCNNI